MPQYLASRYSAGEPDWWLVSGEFGPKNTNLRSFDAESFTSAYFEKEREDVNDISQYFGPILANMKSRLAFILIFIWTLFTVTPVWVKRVTGVCVKYPLPRKLKLKQDKRCVILCFKHFNQIQLSRWVGYSVKARRRSRSQGLQNKIGRF